MQLFASNLTQYLPFGKTLGRSRHVRSSLEYLRRHRLLLRPDQQPAAHIGLAFLGLFAGGCVRGRGAVFRVAARKTRPPRAAAHDLARAVSETHPAAPLQSGRHLLSVLQRVHGRHRIRLGGARLSVHHQRHHRGAGRGVRPGRALGAAGRRLARDRHRSDVPRLRARLLVQSLAQPQGAVAVGIPQSAPHRRSAHADH